MLKMDTALICGGSVQGGGGSGVIKNLHLFENTAFIKTFQSNILSSAMISSWASNSLNSVPR